MNHCIHGTALDSYCPACTLDVMTFEVWAGGPIGDVQSFPALLSDCASA